MFQLRNLFNVSAKLCRQSVIQKIFKHRQSFSTGATAVSTNLSGYESEFAHAVLENNPKCKVLRGEQNEKNFIGSAEIDLDQNWKELSTSGIVESLERIRNYCKQNGTTISDGRFDKFVRACTERSFDFTDDQLIQSLQILTRFPPTESPKSRNFHDLWNAFDDVCVERIAAWDINRILYVCDHWHLGRINKFISRGSVKVGRKLRTLPPHQLVQLTFYLSIKRIEILDMLEVERNLVKSMDDFTLNEIAVVCLAFFKTQTRMKTPELIEKIYRRSIGEIVTIESIPLTCILKTLRHSSMNAHAFLVREMLNAADNQLPRLSTLSCLHVALLGTHLQICHQRCIEQILHRFSDEIKSIRLKDFERISYVMGVFDFQSESNIESRLCQQFLAELKNRDDEIAQYPKCLRLCLHYLTLKGYYDEEMISVALATPTFSEEFDKKTHYDHELFALDAFAKINLKGTYKGNQLTETNRRHMGKMLIDCIPDRRKNAKVSFADDILLALKEASDELYTHSVFAHTVPHFNRPDIVIAYDRRSNTGIDIGHNLPPPYSGVIVDRSMLVKGLSTDAGNVEIVNIIVGGWSNYIRETEKMNGFTRQKIEQLQILGLRPVIIPWFVWKRLHKEEWKPYVRLKVNEALRDS